MAKVGYFGDHFSSCGPGFIGTYVAPLVASRHWDAEVMARLGRPSQPADDRVAPDEDPPREPDTHIVVDAAWFQKQRSLRDMVTPRPQAAPSPIQAAPRVAANPPAPPHEEDQ